jgi:secreted PhoX family phosphatase
MRVRSGPPLAMCAEFNRRETLETLAMLALSGVATTGVAEAKGRGRGHGHGKNEPTLNRFATTVAGAEFTGIYLTKDGQLFFNVQHPTVPADERYRPGAIGVVTGVDMTALPDDFESVQPPKSPAEYVKTARGSYQVLAEGCDETRDGKLLGVPYTSDGVPMTVVTKTDGDAMPDSYGNAPDFNAFIPSEESADEGYLFTNWEDTPGLMSRLHLTQSRDTSQWNVREKMNVDFRSVEGTWNNCFGTVSPWGTPLTSEEYEPDAATWYSPIERTYGFGEQDMEQYLGYFGNPYRYGYIVEIEEPQSLDPKPNKHYVMGRFAHENAVVMPDRRTAYLSDDGTGTVFFKFVADEPGDLSAGTLYAAHAKMQGPGDDPEDVAFKLDWIELAHGTDEEIESWIAEYDGQEPSMDANYITDEEVTAWANGNADDDRVAFLESRKAAAALGATDEFRKMEGVNIKRNARPGDFLYMAMSEVNESMLANEETAADDPQDTIRLEGNDYGAVYRMRLDGNYNVHRMVPAIVGGPDANICGGCPYDARPNSKSTVCQDCAFNPAKDKQDTPAAAENAKGLNKATETAKGLVGKGMAKLTKHSHSVDPENTIANPDNLVVMPDGRVVIGEDSGFHRPNMLWVYDPKN